MEQQDKKMINEVENMLHKDNVRSVAYMPARMSDEEIEVYAPLSKCRYWLLKAHEEALEAKKFDDCAHFAKNDTAKAERLRFSRQKLSLVRLYRSRAMAFYKLYVALERRWQPDENGEQVVA